MLNNIKKNIYLKRYIKKIDKIAEQMSNELLKQSSVKIEKKQKNINKNKKVFAIKLSGINKINGLINNIYFILTVEFLEDKVKPELKIKNEYEIEENQPFTEKVLETLLKEGYKIKN